MDRYETTFRTWNSIAALYQEKFMALRLYDDTYDLFCSEIKASRPKVLEIGCGPGNITSYLLKKHPDYQITGIDVAPAMIELAKENNPSAAFKVMDCRELDQLNTPSLQKKYDAVMCGFCLPYLSKEDTAKLLKDSAAIMNTGGIIYLSAIEGDYESSGFQTAGNPELQAYVYYYDEETLKQLLHEHQFELLHTARKPYPAKDGGTSTHLILIARLKA